MASVQFIRTAGLFFGWMAAAAMATALQAGDKPSDEANYSTRLAAVAPWNAGKPVINGPDIFGASPNKDFLFSIPTVGERPMRFSAQNLPAGLSVDVEKGVIRGKAQAKGEYSVTLTAENKLGQCSKTLKLVIDDNAIALTPPMGWNSWNCYRSGIDDAKIRTIGDGMVSAGLASYGYVYVNMDSGWQSTRRGGKFNSIMPHAGFPNMKALCDYLHALGLKAGIYSGPYVVPWGTNGCGCTSGVCDTNFSWVMGPGPGFHQKYIGVDKHEHEDVSQWADWGFDYFKYDWGNTDMILTERMSRELRKSSRDIVFSVTTGVAFRDADKVKALANLWRSNGDTTPEWKSVVGNGFSGEAWNAVVGPGHWFDLDMTALKPMAKKSLTHDEQIACLSCWMMRPSPIMIDVDLTKPLDDFTRRLLCNAEIIAVNQDALGKPSACILKKDSWNIQIKPLADGNYALAVFNLGEKPRRSPSIDLAFFGFGKKFKARDLWACEDLGELQNGFTVNVAAHSAKVFKVFCGGPTAK